MFGGTPVTNGCREGKRRRGSRCKPDGSEASIRCRAILPDALARPAGRFSPGGGRTAGEAILCSVKQTPLMPVVLAVSILAISTAALFIKLCDDAGPVVIAAARMGIAAVALFPVAGVVHGRSLVRLPPGSVGYVVLGGIFLAAHFYFWISSLKLTSVLSSVVIVTTNPIFVGIASYLLFKERAGRRLVAGIALAAVGGGLIAMADAGAAAGSLHGDVLSLCGAVMASCYLLVGRHVRRNVDTLSYILPVYAIAAAVLVAVAAVKGESAFGYRPSTYVYFLLLGLVPQVIGHSAFNWALRHLSATFIAVCILGEPVGASLFAFFVLKESVTPAQAVGSCLILTGIFLAARSQVGKG